MGSKIKCHELMTVTPALAKLWLESNYERNRNIRASHKAKMVADMRAGAFDSENGQTIVVGEDGKLYDGQHRLSALVEAGVSMPFLVVTISDGEEAFPTIDSTAPRATADFLYNSKNRPLVAAIAKVGFCIECTVVPLLTVVQGNAEPGRTASRAEVLKYANEHMGMLEEIATAANRMRKAVGYGGPSVYGTFILLVKYVGRDALLDEFVSDVSEIVPLNKTVTAFKTLVLKQKAKGIALTTKWLLGTILDAYEHFCDMDDSVMLNQRAARLSAYDSYLAAARAKKED